ncbi:MAG: ribonuclease P protein component [Chloroflexi bacterium]|nr:MAG: ribonuclease P protein component [Chloroflexota bacterium]
MQVQRQFRLTRSTDFKRVRQDGKSYAHPLLVLIALKDRQSTTRIGVAAGKSVGNAVKRNRAKRLIRAAARDLYPQISSGYDLVLIARAPIIQVKMPQVRTALQQLLQRANLLNEA